jgi:Rrf2 family transcriptional regulator, repressor of oqxAB
MLDLRFPTALQMVLSVALGERDHFRVTSQSLADGLGANPVLIRRLMGPLGRDGILNGFVGKGGGIKLGRAAKQITLRDIYQSALGGKPALSPRPDVAAKCRVSANFGDLFAEVSLDVEGAILERLSRRTIAQTLDRILEIHELSGRVAPVIERLSLRA